jgi:hypothetical protein
MWVQLNTFTFEIPTANLVIITVICHIHFFRRRHTCMPVQTTHLWRAPLLPGLYSYTERYSRCHLNMGSACQYTRLLKCGARRCCLDCTATRRGTVGVIWIWEVHASTLDSLTVARTAVVRIVHAATQRGTVGVIWIWALLYRTGCRPFRIFLYTAVL